MPLTTVFAGQQGSANSPEWALPEVLRDLVQEGDADFVLDLIRAFEDDTAVRLRDTRKSAVGGDRSGVRRHAHTIKGSARQMGAMALAAVCEQLELTSADIPVSELIAYIDAAETEFTKACQAMSSYSPQNGQCDRREV
jgi:HPt (histidine-containing phosphotransfer) domain-containing protein